MIPDWHGFVRPADSRRLAEALETQRAAAAQTLRDCLEGHFASERVEAARTKEVLGYNESVRKANRGFALAVEWQLRRGAGVLLTSFTPQRRLTPLPPTWRRYLVPAQCVLTGQQRMRVCVQEGADGPRRFELPLTVCAGKVVYPTWHVCSDMGSIGWPCLSWLSLSKGLRMTQIWDRCHRITCDWDDAIKESGLMLTKLNFISVCNARLGPWDKQKNHMTMKAMARELFENNDEQCPLFQVLYPDICEENQWHHEPGFGLEVHYKRVWQRCREELTRACVGQALKRGRWWSLESRLSLLIAHKGGAAMTFMLLLYMGFRKHWWTTFENSPLQHFSVGDEAEGAPPDVFEAPAAALGAEHGGSSPNNVFRSYASKPLPCTVFIFVNRGEEGFQSPCAHGSNLNSVQCCCA